MSNLAQTISILIVDDNDLQHRMISDFLTMSRETAFHVDSALTYNLGYQKLTTKNYDVCIMDYDLGGKTGIELMKAIREEGIHLPIVFLSGQNNRETDLEAMEAGASDYIDKSSLKPKMLERAIRYAMSHHKTRHQLENINQEVEQRNRELAAIFEIGKALSSLLYKEEIFQLIYEEVAYKIFDVAKFHVYFFDTQASNANPILVCEFAVENNKEIDPTALPKIQYANNDMSEAARALSTQIVTEKIDPENGETEPTEQSRMYIPLVQGDQVYYVLMLETQIGDIFDEGSIEFVSTLANQSMIALRNADLYQQMQQHSNDLALNIHERTVELERAKKNVEVILNSSSDAIILLETDGFIQQVNPAFITLFGFIIDDVFNKHITTTIHEKDVEEFNGALRKTRDNVESNRARITMIHKNGAEFEADVVLSPLRRGKNDVEIICTVRDISEQVKIERELRSALGREKELSDLKSRFVSMVSHEFRTPLATIQASAEVLENYLEKMDEQQKQRRFKKIHQQIEHVSMLLDEILTVEHLKNDTVELRLKPIDMDVFSKEMLEEFRLTDSKKQQFEYQYDNNCAEFWADERLIRQILTNLISNAIKYSPEKSIITLTLSCDNEHATLQVKDQGIGIPQSDQKHIFDQFTRASNVGAVSGTGMGLAIVHRSVKLHKGTISFESEDDKGTTFTVTLPMSLTEEIPVVEGILE